jgi:hypothetical protein
VKSSKVAQKQAKPFKPKIVSPQASKTNKTSAKEIQQHKVQTNKLKSKPKTASVPSSSASASDGKNQSNPLSINQTERRLNTLSE